MRLPEKPPVIDISKMATEDSKNFVRLFKPDVNELVRKINSEYRPWDKVRFATNLPEGVSVKGLWVAVSLSRNGRINLPLPLGKDKGRLSYWNPPSHQELLSVIDRQSGGLISTSHSTIPGDNERYVFNSLMEEAIASSQLEGAITTREIAKEILRTQRGPRNESERMIVNNFQAMLEVRELKNEPLSAKIICHLQDVLTKGTLKDEDAGNRFRRSDEQVIVEDSRDGEPVYFPPDADKVPEMIDKLCDFANKKTEPFMHPVLKAIALHFYLGYVHPFVDGNGRTARAVFYWYMLRNGFWLFEYLPISRIIKAAQIQYSLAYLYTETDNGDLTYFLNYNLDVIIRAINDFNKYFLSQQQIAVEGLKLLDSYPSLNYRQRDVIQEAIKKPKTVFTIREHQGEYRVTYNTARSDLIELEQLGLLEILENKAGMEKRYRVPADLIKRLHPDGRKVKEPKHKPSKNASRIVSKVIKKNNKQINLFEG